MTETAEQIAARYGAVCRPGLQVTVCPPYATTDEAWHPMPAKEQMRMDAQRRALGARLRAADGKPLPQPVERLVVVSGPTKVPEPKPEPKPVVRAVRRAERASQVSASKARMRRDSFEAVVRQMHADGHCFADIARHCGVVPSTMGLWCQHWGLSVERVNPTKAAFDKLCAERGDEVRRLHAQGLFDGQIADAMGIHPRQANRLRVALGLPRQPKAAGCFAPKRDENVGA